VQQGFDCGSRGRRVKFEASVLEDKRVWLLINELLGGSVKELNPVLDSTAPYGFRYPEAEQLLEADPKKTVDWLQKLWSAGILEADLKETVLLCTACGSPDLHPHRSCPRCQSARLASVDIIEHFSCGHIGAREAFLAGDGKLQCPHCKVKLRGEQQDYQQQKAVQCLDCKSFSAQPKTTFRCFKCNATMAANEPSEQPIYLYRLNMEHRGDIIHYLGYHPIPESERPTREKHRLGLDELDRRILNIMQEDARLSFRTIARRLRVSDATIRDRVARLQENDIIRAFTVLVDPQKAGMEVTCLIQLEVRPEQVPSTVASLSSVDEVKLVMETGERQNVLVLAIFPDRAALNQFLDKAVRGQPGVQLSNVTITLNLRKFDWLIRM